MGRDFSLFFFAENIVVALTVLGQVYGVSVFDDFFFSFIAKTLLVFFFVRV